jgi:exosortase/archaeosortase family protein
LSGNILIIADVGIELVNACVAGSAYYLLLILNLATPMKLKKRAYSIMFSFLCLLVLNILRIFVFSVLFLNDFSFFDTAHKLFWYGLSTVFVVAIWFLTVKLFRIKEIPVYSDVRKILNH